MEKRNISVAEYFEIIQREYVIADFRRKIYPSPKDKAYYQRLMTNKREKIEDIAKRNFLDSIFSSSEKMEAVRKELFDSHGKPTFMQGRDIEYYYMVGNEFSYQGDIWYLDKVVDDVLVIYSTKREEYKKVSKDEICRIL